MTVTTQFRGQTIIWTRRGWKDAAGYFFCYLRGHRVIGGAEALQGGDELLSFEDGAPFDRERPCIRCGRPPTAEGHDACLGRLPGVRSACCGHGVDPGYILYNDGHEERQEALD